jgi:hypothetical protein
MELFPRGIGLMTRLHSLDLHAFRRCAPALIVAAICLPGAVRLLPAAGNDPVVESSGQADVAAGHNLLQDASSADHSVDADRLRFRDLDGQAYYVAELRQKGPVAFVFLSTSCPVARQYTQRLLQLHESFADSGVQFFAVFSNHEDDRPAITEYARTTRLAMPIVADRSGDLARQLGATMTPQALVIDRSGQLAYRGAIDDHRYTNRVKRHYLRDALTALCAAKPVTVTHTRALGCSIHLADTAGEGPITYSRHIAPIVQDHCQACHRSGQIGPFPLTSYEEVRTWSTEMAAYTGERLMPPWKAVPDFNHFQGDRSLSDHQIDLIRRWVQSGTPQGDPEDAPPAPRFAEQWALGPPDLIVDMPEEYVVAAEGEDDYRHFIVPSNYAQDRYIRAVDVQPGNRRTVHHVIVYTDTTGRARELDADDPGPGYTNFGGPGFDPASSPGGWAPGSNPQELPAGTGHLLPKGADIVVQVHYYRTGVEERDRTRVGLYFSDSPSPAVARTPLVINTEFEIPPGDSRHQVTASWDVPRDVYALSVFPHMHLLGKEMKVTVQTPEGDTLPMVWIKDWDFNWQQWYVFRDPMLLPKGSKVQMTAWFDNSTGNPNNPHDPPKAVRWGEKTTDEMAIAFLTVVRADQWQPSGAATVETADRRAHP